VSSGEVKIQTTRSTSKDNCARTIVANNEDEEMNEGELIAGRDNLTKIMKEEGTYVKFRRLLARGQTEKANKMVEELLDRRRSEIVE
jgi:hypothetical protein